MKKGGEGEDEDGRLINHGWKTDGGKVMAEGNVWEEEDESGKGNNGKSRKEQEGMRLGDKGKSGELSRSNIA